MTTQEKLDKAIEFIAKIEKMQFDITDAKDIIDDANIYCDECGIKCNYDVVDLRQFVNARILEELKEQVWHVLVDLKYE